MSTPIADAVAEMFENSIPKEVILLAIRSMELALSTRQAVDETAERRREWDRNYRRKRRGIPPDPPEIHPTSADTSPLSLGDKRGLSEVVDKKEEKKKARGCKLPPDWKPKESHYAEGLKRNMDRAAVDAKADDMRVWSDANANRAITTKANWDQTFTGWIRREPLRGAGTINARTDAGSGRANTKEAQFIAAMGRGALGALAQGASARQDGSLSRGDDPTRGDGFDWRTKNAG